MSERERETEREDRCSGIVAIKYRKGEGARMFQGGVSTHKMEL